MANFTAADVKKLRELTAAGMMDCKKALEEAEGDLDKAVEILRVKGQKGVTKRATTGSIIFCASNDEHGWRNAADGQTTYYVIRAITGATPRPAAK